jgi:cob(I)alamin adenosyltransferase
LGEEEQARTREGLAAMRRRADRRSKGLVIINTGNGKGKTTAALGVVLRAWGQRLRVAVFQFMKTKTANFGEIKALRKIGIPIEPLGGGFTWTSKDLAQDRALAQAGWERCRAAIASGDYDLVVLDEITYCFTYGWLDLPEVLAALVARPAGEHVILTGRDAPAELVAFADLVTEMTEIKHPFQAGILAQKGIEF